MTNVVDVEYANSKEKQIKTVWHRTYMTLGHGSDMVTSIIEGGAFSFPKSVYSTKDAIA